MAHSLSAKKRVRQNEKRRLLNRSRVGAVKSQVKKFNTLVKDGNLEKLEAELVVSQKKIDKLAATGLVHKNKASRQKSQLARQVNAMKARTGGK